MKAYQPFTIVVLGSIIFLTINTIFQNRDEYKELCSKDFFFVSLPENCQSCPNKQAKYINWNEKSIWACVSDYSDENFFNLPELDNKSCPSHKPLKDVLNECHFCNTPQPVQIDKTEINTCLGKRYLTEYRQTFKSQLCPEISQIQNPQICFACHGQWIGEKCVQLTLSTVQLCKKNTDCFNNQWCHPIYYTTKVKGVCRPAYFKSWIFSDLEGYNYDMASIFCERQNAHIPTLTELENEKENILSYFSQTKVWIIFEEGRLYLDSLKTPFIITDERNSILSGGDNTYALCHKN